MKDINKRLELMEYHQELLLQLVRNPKDQLAWLIIGKKLTKQETEEIMKLCEEMNNKFQIEKAEGYVNFQPLQAEMKKKLNPKITLKELTEACRSQGIFLPFMKEISPLDKEH